MSKICAAFAWICVSGLCLAQNPTANESSASSATSSIAPEKPIYMNTVERDNALITQAFTAIAKADELQPLETPDEKILALFKSGETRKQKGALLIMHAPDVPQAWPATLENLRRNLPLYGWATMTLPLPAKYDNAVPEREFASISSSAASGAEAPAAASSTPAETKATANSAPSEPPKPLIPRDKLIGERVEAAIAQLNTLGQFNLVALIDNSSAPDALATLYKQKPANTMGGASGSPLQALILVNLQNQEPLSKEQLGNIFSVVDLPVMDVFFNPDNPEQAELRRQHQAEAMRKNLKDYQQLILPAQPPVSVDDKQSFWLAKVHGFMAKRAEGNEVAGSDMPTRPENISALK